MEPTLGTGSEGRFIFNNYLLRQDNYLPTTFFKQQPVKMCFQNNSADIIDNSENRPETRLLILPNLPCLGFFPTSDKNCLN